MSSLLKTMIAHRWRYLLVLAALAVIGGYAAFGREGDLGPTLSIAASDFDEQVSVSGTVIAAQSVDLGFAASGRIVGVYAKVGQRVAAGTVLAETDNADLIATVGKMQAKLDSLLAGTRLEQVAVSAAAVENAKASLRAAVASAYTSSDDAVRNKADVLFRNPRVAPELSFTSSNSVLSAAVSRERLAVESTLSAWAALVADLSDDTVKSAATKAQAYLAEVGQLLADGNAVLNQGVPDQSTTAATLSSYATTLATARTNVSTAATALTTAISALNEAEKSLTLSQAGPTAADVSAARAELENARALVGKTRIVAPFSGVVTRMDAKRGEIVSPSVSEISMQSDGVFQVETYIPEVAIANVAVGNQATTTLDAYGASAAFSSTVVAVDPAETVKDGVPTYKTVLVFREADPRIRSGMTANVVIKTGLLRDAIIVPSGAIGFDAAGPYVSLVGDGTPTRQPVATGGSPALGRTLITSGLSSGDVILMTPK